MEVVTTSDIPPNKILPIFLPNKSVNSLGNNKTNCLKFLGFVFRKAALRKLSSTTYPHSSSVANAVKILK